ncbi:MAG: hypothetical protein AAFV53_22515 [Myxococcota bacterium]
MKTILPFALLGLTGCGGVGVCQSTAVEFEFGLRVYCYSDYDRAECDANQTDQVNGADWEFHSGQTCDERGLDEGSNPWP